MVKAIQHLLNHIFSSSNLDGYMEIPFNEINKSVRMRQQMGSPHTLSYHSIAHHICAFLKVLSVLTLFDLLTPVKPLSKSI